MNNVDVAKLKRQGYINQSDKEYFTVRLKIQAGNISAEQMVKVSAVAQKYGRGYAGFTTRLGIEIPWIKFEDLETVKGELAEVGLAPGGTGPTVRSVVACKGSICVHGLIDTQELCRQLDEKFFAQELAAKFKIGIAGCPNNCSKAQLNDLGFMGQCVPELNKELCLGCESCTSLCKVGALEPINGKVQINREKCVNCGKCVKACPAGAVSVKEQGFAVYLGGKFGRKYRIGDRIDAIFAPDQVVEVTGKIIRYYKDHAEKGERLADMLDRVGFINALAAVTKI